ncbi:DUF2804 domain-containing protein [Marinobacter salinisoli]|uniref:DUF2804 domain-containing protein n=1 Tax=Marinobacter salinisoli TaxID=2769486 RepID=A0ABX7MVT1_9GAMM|nr:DUF2804 domain-containing protein [Marinobacter salinisoli]QSP96263.1 DUF2804 domain-containing protein [Marinobacter salinisoli]
MMVKKLVDESGRIAPGLCDGVVDEINYQAFDLRNAMDKPRSRLARRWRFNQFQFVSAMAPDWVFGMAIVDLKLVANGFFYLYDFASGTLHEQSFLAPLARGARIEPRPEQGASVFAKGDAVLSILPGGEGRSVRVKAPGDIRVDLTLHNDDDPLRLVSPAGYNGWVFTRKSAGLPVTGQVRWGQEVWRCDEGTRGSIDWSCGFMRRETAWNWACMAGQLPDGRSLGLNLAAGVNETGVTENALWLDGRCLKLGIARFDFDRQQPGKQWRVTTDDGRVDLMFEPAGVRQERLNVFVLASNFRQFIGTFSGFITHEGGERLAIASMRGLMEDHYARW